jgi:hypothetical protein
MVPTLLAALLTVQVNLVFDPAISPTAIARVAKAEVKAIWESNGVDIVWTDTDGQAAMCLDAFVEGRRSHAANLEPMVLGRAVVAPSDDGQAPIRVAFDAIDAVVQSRPGVPLGLREYTLATALGRVLAHEIGHILLGAPAYHDTEGLMRAAFPTNELAPPERARFQLTERSANRLRARIAALSARQWPERCSPPENAAAERVLKARP